jgi:hypothetical protein
MSWPPGSADWSALPSPSEPSADEIVQRQTGIVVVVVIVVVIDVMRHGATSGKSARRAIDNDNDNENWTHLQALRAAKQSRTARGVSRR